MRFRTTLILGVILIALGLFMYFLERGEEANKAAKDQLLLFDSNLVTEVKLTYQGTTIVCKQMADGQWRLLEPVDTEADRQTLRSLLSTLGNARIVREVIPDSLAAGTDLGQYGLNPPQAEIAILEGKIQAEKPVVLYLGNESPTGAFYFARRGEEGGVVLVNTTVGRALQKRPFDLRDKQILGFDRDKVKRVEIRKNNQKLMVAALDSSGFWRLREPVAIRAEKNHMVNLIGDIRNLKVARFVDDQPRNLRRYGLQQPHLSATVTVKGDTTYTLRVGKQVAGGDSVYVMGSIKPGVFLVGRRILERLDVSVADMRAHTIAAFKSYEVDRIDWDLGGEQVTTVKHAFEDWRITRPIERRADDRLLNALLDSLEILRVKEFIPLTPAGIRRYGLDSPALKGTFYLNKGNLTQVFLVSLEQDGFRYLQDTAEQWIYKVRAGGLRSLPTTLVDLRDKAALHFKAHRVQRLEVKENKERRFYLRRKGRDKWVVEEPVNGKGDIIKVGKVLGYVESMRAHSFVTTESADLAAYGLAAPRLSVTVYLPPEGDAEEAQRLVLLIGKTTEQDSSLVYAKRADQPDIFLLEASQMEYLRNLIANPPLQKGG